MHDLSARVLRSLGLLAVTAVCAVSGAWAQSSMPTVSSDGRTDVVTTVDETPAAKRARIRLELASAYFAQGQTTTALDEVKRALAADPENVGAFNLRGLIYGQMGEHTRAEESFREALRLRSDDLDTLHNYAWYLCRQQRYPESRQVYATAMQSSRYQASPKSWLTQGICEARAGDLDKAERYLMHSYELDAGNPATAVNLSEVLLRRGDLQRSLFYVQRVNQRAELVRAETLWLEARVQHRKGDAEAVAELGARLRDRYPSARETAAFEQGKFNE